MKNSKGITLIALVITIIVLLILAGVSIAMLTGDNGLLSQAKNADKTTEQAAIAEKVNIATQTAYTKHVTANPTNITQLPVENIATEYKADNPDITSAQASGTTLTIVDGDKTYTVTLEQVGKSYKTDSTKVAISATQ